MQDQDEIVAAWLRYQETGARVDFWATGHLMEVTAKDADPELGWTLVEALYRAAPDELLARREPRFRATLRRIWLTEGALPRNLEERVVRASNGGIKPLRNSQARRRRR